jgi:hypothetical protein
LTPVKRARPTGLIEMRRRGLEAGRAQSSAVCMLISIKAQVGSWGILQAGPACLPATVIEPRVSLIQARGSIREQERRT